MPPIDRPAATGGPVRRVARHWWQGAGIPKVEGSQLPAEAGPPGLGLTAALDGGALRVRMVNEHAGHLLPTGDPERWVQVDVRFLDGGSRPVGEASSWRIGQVWTWEPAPKKVSDNRLRQGEERSETIPVPPGATLALVEASSHRMSKENAAYHELLGRYPLSVTTHRLEVALP